LKEFQQRNITKMKKRANIRGPYFFAEKIKKARQDQKEKETKLEGTSPARNV